MTLAFRTQGIERGDTVHCSICDGAQKLTGVANTELYTHGGLASACNFAFRMGCGHIFVDDCRTEELNGECFRDEGEWRRRVVTETY